MSLPKRAHERLVAGLKKFQPVFEAAKNRDVSESDTAVIIADFLADALGYQKYIEVTTEFAIRGTYCDLAIKIDEKLCFLIEVKAIGVDLKEHHVKQAVDYGANKGCEWVVLTNGVTWRAYRVGFGQPITTTLVAEVNILKHSHRDEALIEFFASISREGWTKDKIADFFEQMQATNKYALAAALLSESLLTQLRRELRRMFPGVRVDQDFLEKQLRDEVIKRELVEGEHADAAAAMLKKIARRLEKEKDKGVKEKVAEPVSTPSSPAVEDAA